MRARSQFSLEGKRLVCALLLRDALLFLHHAIFYNENQRRSVYALIIKTLCSQTSRSQALSSGSAIVLPWESFGKSITGKHFTRQQSGRLGTPDNEDRNLCFCQCLGSRAPLRTRPEEYFEHESLFLVETSNSYYMYAKGQPIIPHPMVGTGN